MNPRYHLQFRGATRGGFIVPTIFFAVGTFGFFSPRNPVDVLCASLMTGSMALLLAIGYLRVWRIRYVELEGDVLRVQFRSGGSARFPLPDSMVRGTADSKGSITLRLKNAHACVVINADWFDEPTKFALALDQFIQVTHRHADGRVETMPLSHYRPPPGYESGWRRK